MRCVLCIKSCALCLLLTRPQRISRRYATTVCCASHLAANAPLISANFAVKEFRCKDGSDPIFIDDELVTLLQKIRDHFGKSVTITSAYRTAAHNKAVKGATYSQHCYGKAADIRVQGVGVEAVAAYAETLLPNRGGIGRYPVKAGRPAGWVHIDTRAVKSRWVG